MAKKTSGRDRSDVDAPAVGAVATRNGRRPGAVDWEYAPAPESAAIGRIRERYQMYAGGRFIEGHGPDLVSINPATEQQVATVSTASTGDVDDAVGAARSAYDRVWSKMSGAERGK